MRNYREESARLKEVFEPGTQVLELTDAFHAAQAGRGEILRHHDGKHQVVDQETGRVWLEAPVPSDSNEGRPSAAMSDAVYALFESEAEVREALFFDEGHPDAEGFQVFAETVAEAWERAAAAASQRGSR